MKTNLTLSDLASCPPKRGTWNDASNMDEYGPPFDGSTFSTINDVRCLNYFAWFESKRKGDIKEHLRHYDIKSALVLEFTTVMPDDRRTKPSHWACFDYANGDKGVHRYVHIYKTRKEAQAVRRRIPAIVFPPIPVWLIAK